MLFAVADDTVDAVPELRTPKVAEKALISIPPFKVVGNIHLLPERNLQESLEELDGRFLPVTDASTGRTGSARPASTPTMVAVNHARAQILAPHREADPWAGLDRAGEAVGRCRLPASSRARRRRSRSSAATRTGWPDSDFER